MINSKFPLSRSPYTFCDAKSTDSFDLKEKSWLKKYSITVPQSGDNGSSVVHHGNDDDRSVVLAVLFSSAKLFGIR